MTETKAVASTTKIEWATHTLNIATGCSRVSPGCDNCYMYAQYPRLKGMHVNGYDADPDTVRLFPDRLAAIAKLARSPKKVRVFVNSMSDSFHKDVPFGLMRDVVQEFARYPNAIGMLLTKRPGRMAYFSERILHDDWPANVWAMTSIESAKYLPRLAVLDRIAAPVLGVSAEPLLGSLLEYSGDAYRLSQVVNWVIVGGESGPNARPMNPAWARELRDFCNENEIAYFMKQWGEWIGVDALEHLRLTDGAPWGWRAASSRHVEEANTFEVQTHLKWFDDNNGAAKIGRKRAGNTLDGRTWTQFPDDPEFAQSRMM